MEKIVKDFLENQNLKKDEFVELIRAYKDPEVVEALKTRAVELRKKYYGDQVFTRGLIEFTNYCKNDCYYCGIRKSNRNADRYRLTEEEILTCCENGYELGFRTFVLQGGEDPYYTDERMESIIRKIKKGWPDCALTLSIGEKSYDSYKRFKEAGATGICCAMRRQMRFIMASFIQRLRSCPNGWIVCGISKSLVTRWELALW